MRTECECMWCVPPLRSVPMCRPCRHPIVYLEIFLTSYRIYYCRQWLKAVPISIQLTKEESANHHTWLRNPCSQHLYLLPLPTQHIFTAITYLELTLLFSFKFQLIYQYVFGIALWINR